MYNEENSVESDSDGNHDSSKLTKLVYEDGSEDELESEDDVRSEENDSDGFIDSGVLFLSSFLCLCSILLLTDLFSI